VEYGVDLVQYHNLFPKSFQNPEWLGYSTIPVKLVESRQVTEQQLQSGHEIGDSNILTNSGIESIAWRLELTKQL